MASPPPPPCSAGKGERPPPPSYGSAMTIDIHDARSLLSGDDFTIVTATLATTHPELGWVAAEQRVLEALKFVAAMACYPDVGLAPSGPVDAGWHALIDNTAISARLCVRLGVFVHHYPAVTGTESPAPGWQDRSMTAVKAAGFDASPDLW
ncbi:hypothetical protein ACIQZO_03710 [Streptomyces sp. NPDC097617]|uniref:hypothetical protein n=1 Tax=Streptomyces sp. NPDC097617 TaxID=3366091 RepID=UPI003816A5D0